MNLSDVTVTNNQIDGIGQPGGTQEGVVSLESLTGTTAGTGATLENNSINGISSINQSRPRTGVTLRPSGNDSAAVVANNSFSSLGIAVSHPIGDTVDVDRSDLATVPVTNRAQPIFTLTVQDAITAAQPGVTVEVGPGTYDESISIPNNVTLLGPNAGIAGSNSSARGPEATLDQRINNVEEGVVIDGIDVNTTALGVTSAIKVNPLDPNDEGAVIRNTVVRPQDPAHTHGFEITGDSGVVTLEDNLVTGTPLTGAIVAAGSTGDPIEITATGNVFAGNATAGIFVADGQTDAAELSVEGNEFDQQGAGVLVGTADAGATLTVEFTSFSSNTFDSGGSDTAYVSDTLNRIDDSTTGIGLAEIRNNNAFTPDAVTIDGYQDVFGNTGDAVVPETAVNVVNVDQRTGFDQIQPAVDAANAGDTIEVKTNTCSESVDITTSGLTLRGVADANGNLPVIEGNGVNTGSQPHAAVHVDDGSGPVRNLTIEGLRITNPSGNFGIFAGTGSTNSNNDGIGGLVVQNNVVDNISSQTTGGSLTGGPAGIGIRGDYGTDGNPGIEISNNQVNNVQSEGFTNAVGITLKSFTGDAGFGFDSSGNTANDPSSPPATNTDILNNDISNIDGGNDSRTKGISVSGEFEDVLVEGNSISGVIANASGTSGNAFGVIFTENGGSYSGNQYDIDNDGNGERIDPRNFTISGNDIAQITTGSPVNIFIGGYEDLSGADDHVVEGNNLNDTGATVSQFAGDQSGYQIGDGDTLDVRNNFWGNSTGPNGEDGVGGSGAPAITVGTDSSGNDRSGKVAAGEPESDPAGHSVTPN